MNKKAKLKILFASANPAGDLNLDSEHREIKESINASSYSQYIEITTQLACQYDDLIDAMNREQPDIIHFSGHGNGEAGLLFSDPHSDTTITINKDTLQERQIGVEEVSGEILQQTFATSKNLKLIVLNACLSESQADDIIKEIDFVIGMNNYIKDSTATIFAKRFYQSFASDVSIKHSFNQAQTQVARKAPDETQTPMIFIKDGNIADIKISDIVDKSLSSGGANITQTHSGSGDNVGRDKVVHNNGVSIGGNNTGAVVTGNGNSVKVENNERKIDAENYFEKIDNSGTMNFD